jgi:hypothetical protein
MEEDALSGIAMLLPQPPTAVTAATLYLVTGIAIFAFADTPVPQRCTQPRGERFGIEPVCVALALGAVVLSVALWPAALLRPLWTTSRTWLTRRASARAHHQTHAHTARSALRTVTRSDEEAVEQPVYLEQPAAALGAPTVRESTDWTQAAAARVVEALHQRRLLDAAWAARSLVWDVEFAFGPNSSQLWHATELLAHVCHEIGDDVRAAQLYARAATGWAQNFGVAHPGARAARERAVAVWCRARAAGATDPVTALLMASGARLFARAGAAV